MGSGRDPRPAVITTRSFSVFFVQKEEVCEFKFKVNFCTVSGCAPQDIHRATIIMGLLADDKNRGRVAIGAGMDA